MREFVKAKPGQETAASFAGPTKLSPELLASFRGIAQAVQIENESKPAVSLERGAVPMRKNRKHKLKTGDFFGHLAIRRKAADRKGVKPTLRKQWHVECIAPDKNKPSGICGTKLVVPQYYLVRPGNPKTHCGCQFKTLKSENSREYRIWHMMHQRCLNPNHTSYKHYQSRGITIHEDFLKTNPQGFENFLADVGPCPTPRHSLDRIRNAIGYMPGNLKWSTSEEQRLNQGDLIGGRTQQDIEDMGMTEEEWVAYVKVHGY